MASTSFRFRSIFRAGFSEEFKKKKKKKVKENREAIKEGTKKKRKHDHTRSEAVFSWHGQGLGGGWGCGHEPRQLCFLSFCLAHMPLFSTAFSPPH